jgi:hypothetical protein
VSKYGTHLSRTNRNAVIHATLFVGFGGEGAGGFKRSSVRAWSVGGGQRQFLALGRAWKAMASNAAKDWLRAGGGGLPRWRQSCP